MGLPPRAFEARASTIPPLAHDTVPLYPNLLDFFSSKPIMGSSTPKFGGER